MTSVIAPSGVRLVSITDHASILPYLSQPPCGPDSMANSPAYYLLTGRRGIWTASDGDQTMIVCRHPNADGEILVFPVGRQLDVSFAESVCHRLAQTNPVVKLSRVTNENRDLILASPYYELEEENLLDWKYPVTILDTKRLAEKQGAQFALLRNKIARVCRAGQIDIIDQTDKRFAALTPEVNLMITDWAATVSAAKGFTPEHLVSSNMHGYQMGLIGTPDFVAKIFLLGNVVMALFTVELPPGKSTANGITFSVRRDIPGASEFAYWWIARWLKTAGYSYLNINGAETASLHLFRQKLSPIQTIPLHTFRYKSTL